MCLGDAGEVCADVSEQTSGFRRDPQWQIWRAPGQTSKCLHTVLTPGRKYETECQIIVEVSLSCSDWKDKEAFLQQCQNKDLFFELQFGNFI